MVLCLNYGILADDNFGLIIPASGEARLWLDAGFIRPISHPPCCFPWFQMFNLWVWENREAWRQLHKEATNKSWTQHLTNQQLYGHLPPISKTIQIIRTGPEGDCWRSVDELLWNPSHGRAGVGRPARTYLQQLCMDTGCKLEN